MKEFYDKITKLNYIIRYSNTPRIKDETVAVHSFMVAAIILKLHEEYNFNLERALMLAICHDIPEFETNDICHVTKQRYPEIREVLKIAEIEALRDLPKSIKSAFQEYSDGETTESKIAHLADIIQCQQYASNEVKLGNLGHMEEIIERAKERIKIMQYKLQGAKR